MPDNNALNWGDTVIPQTMPNVLSPGGGGGSWAPSTWRPGMPGTPSSADLSNRPMPSPEQIEAQRQLITQRMRHYGYPVQQLSDQQVLATMSGLPQGPVQWPDWVQEYFQRHPEAQTGGARPGVDMPYDQTYEDYNMRSRGMSNALTQIGSSYAIPQAALIERYGAEAVDKAWTQSLLDRSMKTDEHGRPIRYDYRTDYR